MYLHLAIETQHADGHEDDMDDMDDMGGVQVDGLPACMSALQLDEGA